MKYLVEIEEAEGRGLIALRIALPPKMRDSVFALHRKLDQQNQSWGKSDTICFCRAIWAKFGFLMICDCYVRSV